MNNAIFFYALMSTGAIVYLQIKVCIIEDKIEKLESDSHSIQKDTARQ